MFDLPPYPDVYTTHHITCVSCQEKFAVTEGNKAEILEDKRWRVVPNQASNINLRFEERRQQRPVVPAPHQVPLPHEVAPQFHQQPPATFTPYPINCPRCGADNRNWLALKKAGKDSNWPIWWQRFPNAKIALLIAMLFALIALFLPELFELSWPQALFLAICTPIATLLLILELNGKWDDLRQDKHLGTILPDSRRVEPRLWVKSFGYLLIAAAAVPVIFFTAGPAAFQIIVEFIDKPPEVELETAVTQIKSGFNTEVNEAVDDLNAFGQEMGQTIKDFPTGNLAQVEQELESLSDDLAQTTALAAQEVTAVGQESINRIDTRLETELAALETARKSARTRFTQEIMAEVRFLALWGLVLGLPLLLAIMLVLPDVKKFANRVDSELPPPVFHSVANMTRLVAWEARQALEISGSHYFDIQWVSVNRNASGGLDLVGLFRDPPDFDMFGRATGELVRAQKHTIHTDKWCRVQDAKIEDVLVPVPAGSPGGVMPIPQQAHHDAPASVRIRLPER